MVTLSGQRASLKCNMLPDALSITRRKLLAILGLLPASGWLRAQQSPGYSTTVKVVNLLAIVRDKQGKLIKDLTQDDFVLDEDGLPQTIRYFSRETDLPLTLGLLVDTSGSQQSVLGEERSASFRFLDKVMREDRDMAFLIHFDFEVEMLQDVTQLKSDMRKAIDLLEVGMGPRRQPQGQGQGQGGPRIGGGGRRGRGGGRGQGQGGGRGGGGTALYDAVFLGADEIMKRQHGRKALIILSDGVDHGSKLSLFQAVESAQRSDTLVYSILFDGDEGFGRIGETDGKKVLERISRETGGRFFQVSKRTPLDKVYQMLDEELRNQYSIGYTPETKTASSEYRRLHLSTKQKNLIVQTREGYYPE